MGDAHPGGRNVRGIDHPRNRDDTFVASRSGIGLRDGIGAVPGGVATLIIFVPQRIGLRDGSAKLSWSSPELTRMTRAKSIQLADPG